MLAPDLCRPHCKGPLIEIDHCGERFVGCIECHRWSWRGSDRLFNALDLGEPC
jgi:hypothetical protein